MEAEVWLKGYCIFRLKCPLLLTDHSQCYNVCSKCEKSARCEVWWIFFNISGDTAIMVLCSRSRGPVVFDTSQRNLHVCNGSVESARSEVSEKSFQWKKRYSREITSFSSQVRLNTWVNFADLFLNLEWFANCLLSPCPASLALRCWRVSLLSATLRFTQFERSKNCHLKSENFLLYKQTYLPVDVDMGNSLSVSHCTAATIMS